MNSDSKLPKMARLEGVGPMFVPTSCTPNHERSKGAYNENKTRSMITHSHFQMEKLFVLHD